MNAVRIGFQSLYLLLALCFGPAVFGQQARPQTATRHTLWKVEGKHGALYLLGSVHLLKAEDYPLPAPMEAAFTNSPIAVFETDMAAMEDPQVQMKILSKAQLPEGETLAQQLSTPVYAMFTNHVQSAGLPAAMFDRLKPTLAALTLAMMEIQELGFSPEHGIDKHYYERARKAGKHLVNLETVDFQIDLVTEFTKEEGELVMKTTLEELDKTKSEFGEIIKAWKTGDSATLERLLNEASRQAPVIYKRMLTDRNERWVPRLEELLRGEENALVIVGAGHLVGSDGVVERLKQKGWKVTQQ
ncbi:MAG TPA: TraB/GumN family protein [Candidatus Acidoferrum sp.]|nr:TraB/GumN family protein [Candidatus Acidoferrum sp.]